MSSTKEPDEGRIPKEILIGRSEPSVRQVQVVISMKDEVGAMASISSIMAGLGVNIRQSATHTLPDGTALYNAFVAFKDDAPSTDRLVKKLTQSPFVLNAEATMGRDGTIIDEVSFPVNWQGRRVVVLAQSAMARMFESVRRTFGSGGDVVLYQQGSDYGKDLAQFFTSTFGREFLLRSFDYGVNILSSTGWGIPELVETKEGFPNMTVKLSSCFECAGVPRGHVTCSFTRGVLAGVLTTIAGFPVQCAESKCSGRWDAQCEFELRGGKNAPTR